MHRNRFAMTGAASLPSYDEVPYTALPFVQSHPSRLAAMARLFGIESPPVATARVLELGCALGGNLIPMAVSMPDASLLGIDLSARQIEDGNRVVHALGLENIELRHADIADIDESWGRFDYIIAHGIYSWVPQPIREKLLEICHVNLAPTGVAYVSYNTHPGWKLRAIARDLMLYHSRNESAPAERIRMSREALDFLGHHLPQDTPYAAAMRDVLDGLSGVADAYLSHDHLEADNEAFYFHQFVDAARAHQLQYLGEAEFSAMAPQVPAELKDTLRRIAPDLIAREQYLDFLHHRSFRQTLLVHSDAPINRNVEPRTMGAFDYASSIAPESASFSLAQGAMETLSTPAGASISTASALAKAALIELSQRWPLPIGFAELLDRARFRLGPSRASTPIEQDARMLAIDLLQCYAAAVIELRTWSPTMALLPGLRPQASVLARLQAQRGGDVTNLLHRSILMNPVGRALLPLLDGTRNRDQLAAALSSFADRGDTVVPMRTGGVRALVDETLSGLGRAALLQR